MNTSINLHYNEPNLPKKVYNCGSEHGNDDGTGYRHGSGSGSGSGFSHSGGRGCD